MKGLWCLFFHRHWYIYNPCRDYAVHGVCTKCERGWYSCPW